MKKTILLIDDDYLDIESVNRALKKLNAEFEVVVAHNGVDGLAALTGNAAGTKVIPDIILLDINMPKMNGIEFLRIIKSYYSLKSIKTFVLTTSAEDYDRIAAENLGVSGYLIKPLNFNLESSRNLLEELMN